MDINPAFLLFSEISWSRARCEKRIRGDCTGSAFRGGDPVARSTIQALAQSCFPTSAEEAEELPTSRNGLKRVFFWFLF
jgi:hypothetical protein